MASKHDHVALNVFSNDLSPSAGLKRSRSVWRSWNRLPRFQRLVIYLTTLVCILFVVCVVMYAYSSTDIVELQQEQQKFGIKGETRGEIAYKEIMKNNEERNAVNNESPVQVIEEPNNNGAQPQEGDEGNGEDNNNNNVVLSPPKTNKAQEFSGPSTDRQIAVVDAFKHAWKGYKRFAWGHDNLKPISEGYSDWFGLGLSIVDSLDTMYIMGLKREYEEAREWVDKHLHFNVNRDVNLFEVTIRVLGGLLSIYHLSNDKMYLNKAIDLGDRLLPCFESESGVPFSDVNLFTRRAHAPKWSPDSSTSEVTTIQLEFRDLSRSSGNPKYEEAIAKVSMHVHNLEKKDGLVPIFINANTGQFRTFSTITLGARGDSYYEYLLKQWIQSGKTIDYLKEDYLKAIEGVEKHLAKRTTPNGFLFIGELLVGGKDFKPKMDHLTCYLPGTLMLGHHLGMPASHLKLAEELLQTCYQTYAQQPTFLAPEITYFNIQGESSNDMYVKTNDAHNLLRPEFIESLWYMYQFTRNTTYQDWGWKIFQGFEKYTKVVNGYTSIGNVRSTSNLRYKDMMESFFLSETLKYLYLLFSDDPKLLDLDKFVINSEAHPLPIYTS